MFARSLRFLFIVVALLAPVQSVFACQICSQTKGALWVCPAKVLGVGGVLVLLWQLGSDAAARVNPSSRTQPAPSQLRTQAVVVAVPSVTEVPLSREERLQLAIDQYHIRQRARELQARVVRAADELGNEPTVDDDEAHQSGDDATEE